MVDRTTLRKGSIHHKNMDISAARQLKHSVSVSKPTISCCMCNWFKNSPMSGLGSLKVSYNCWDAS